MKKITISALCICVALCSTFAVESFDKIFAPTVVAVPPADAVMGLCKMPDGSIRHYNYGGQPENSSGGAHSFGVTNRMYIESTDHGITWRECQAKEGEEFGVFYSPFYGRFFNFLNIENTAWFLACDATGKCVEETQICPWPLEFNAEPLVVGKRILMPVTLRTSSSQKANDFGFGAIFLISDDFGKTWKKSARLDVPRHVAGGLHKGTRWNHGAMELSAIELKDGRLWALIRTSLDNLWQSHSKDGGMTWSKPTPTLFYATCVMPKIKRLSDGRLLLMWTNASPLAEKEGANGIWEDVFTNRNVIHAAISADDGKTWRGFREIMLDERRNAADFAETFGGDKSMHQSQFIEIAPNKILAAVGQNKLHRKIAIFDTQWLCADSRESDFANGLDDWSVFNYKKGRRGHCAYNRVAGCKIVSGSDGKKALEIKYEKDDTLENDARGAVWNFPMSPSGKIEIEARFAEGFAGAKLMLHDRWINPADENADKLAAFAFELPAALGDGNLRRLTVEFDTTNLTALLFSDGVKIAEVKSARKLPIGVSYAHFQTLKNLPDAGFKIERIKSTSKNSLYKSNR